MDGLLVIDKPSGPTSHDVVARLRRATGERRIGHTGTLDPAASGVLPLVLGRATRLARFLSSNDKSYDAVVQLGVATDTYDAAGVAAGPLYDGPWPSAREIDHALEPFRGTFLQQPPSYSAKKIDGKRSYNLARARSHARSAPLAAFFAPPARSSSLPAPVAVTAHAIDTVSCSGGGVTLRIDCSAGFYVRSLAHDLGERLGIGAHLAALRRTRSGDQTLANALTLDVVEREPARATEALVPLGLMLPNVPAVVLTMDGVQRAEHGRDLGPHDFEDAEKGGRHFSGRPLDKQPYLFVRLLDSNGELVGIGEPSPTPGLLHPTVVLV